MFQKQLRNPFFLLLLAGNFYCIWYFQNHENGFATVVWIYWWQSIIIGFFNFVDLLTIKNYDPSNFQVNGQPLTAKNKGCLPWFFAVHFGFFHLGYAIFLAIQFGGKNVDGTFLLIGIAAFLMESLSAFLRRKRAEKNYKFNMGSLFFLPYLRVVPMHLMIMAPAFTGLQPSVVFLVLKMIADVLAYFMYERMYEKAMRPG